MALIAMCAYSTEENKKDDCLARTLHGLRRTVDFSKHRLMLSVNGHTPKTKVIIDCFSDIIETVYWNEKNLGTAEAINLIWKDRYPREHCLKMDDDIEIYQAGWLDDLEQILNRDTTIGQAALKRVDLTESPDNENPNYRSTLRMLNHEPGQRWLVVEEVPHCIGSCVLHSHLLLDKIGYLNQPFEYGFDDILISYRSHYAGFKNVFFPHVLITHLDEGKTPYQKEKEAIANKSWDELHRLMNGYLNGSIPLYYNPF